METKPDKRNLSAASGTAEGLSPAAPFPGGDQGLSRKARHPDRIHRLSDRVFLGIRPIYDLRQRDVRSQADIDHRHHGGRRHDRRHWRKSGPVGRLDVVFFDGPGGRSARQDRAARSDSGDAVLHPADRLRKRVPCRLPPPQFIDRDARHALGDPGADPDLYRRAERRHQGPEPYVVRLLRPWPGLRHRYADHHIPGTGDHLRDRSSQERSSGGRSSRSAATPRRRPIRVCAGRGSYSPPTSSRPSRSRARRSSSVPASWARRTMSGRATSFWCWPA